MSDLHTIQVLLIDTDPESIASLSFFASQIDACGLDVVPSKDFLPYIETAKKPDIFIFSYDPGSSWQEIISAVRARNPDVYIIVILPGMDLEQAGEFRKSGVIDGVFRIENYLGNLRHCFRKALTHFRDEKNLTGFAQKFEAGKVIHHYEIVELISSGIRTDVYKVQDLNLNRTVTMKILPPAIASHPVVLRRLKREAMSAGNLKQTGFINVYTIDEAEGLAMLVMEFLEGESLATMLSKGTVGMFHLLDIGAQLSTALDSAHGAGLIHGNLKPSNIFLTPYGEAKLLDFGQPQKISFTPEPGLTGLLQLSRSGVPFDSLFWLSPEQTLGEDPDPRSDVFSLASVFYFAATGEKAFDGSDPYAVINKIQHEECRPPSFWKSHLQGEFEQIILRAMKKNPNARLASASDFQTVLSSLKSRYIPTEATPEDDEGPSRETQTPVTKKKKTTIVTVLSLALLVLAAVFFWLTAQAEKSVSIAILPPTLNSENENFAWFPVAMMDSLVKELSRIHGLQVVQPDTLFHYRNAINPLSNGRKLNTTYLMTGTLLQKQKRWLLSFEWNDLRNGSQKWRRQYVLQPDQLSKVSLDLTRQILESLEIPPNDGNRNTNNPPKQMNPSEQLYWQGRYQYYLHSRENLEESIRFYDLSIENDPTSAVAYSARALSFLDLAQSGIDEISNFKEALNSSSKAIDLEDSLAEPHMVAGAVNLLYQWDFNTAESELDRALSLNPNSSRALSYRALLFVVRREPEIATKTMIVARERDPLSPTIMEQQLRLFIVLGKYDQAIEMAHEYMDVMDPIRANALLGDAYLGKRNTDEALRTFRRCQELGEKDAPAKIAMVLADEGMKREAATLLENLSKDSANPPRNPDWIAAAYARLGDQQNALAWLQKSSETHPSSLIFLRINPDFDTLRRDPDFDRFLSHSGL